MEENGPESKKRKLFNGLLAARSEDISVLIFALTGICQGELEF